MIIRAVGIVAAAALAAVSSSVVAQDSFGGARQQQQPPQQGYPPQQGMPPQQGYPPRGSGTGGGADLDQLMQMERQDYGVAPAKELHSGAMHGPTPIGIPGGQVITTKGLVSLVRGGQEPRTSP